MGTTLQIRQKLTSESNHVIQLFLDKGHNFDTLNCYWLTISDVKTNTVLHEIDLGKSIIEIASVC